MMSESPKAPRAASLRSLSFALLITTALSAVSFSAIISIGPAGGYLGQFGAIVSVFLAGVSVAPSLKLFRLAPLTKRQNLVIGGWCGILGAAFFVYSLFIGFFAKMSGQ